MPYGNLFEKVDKMVNINAKTLKSTAIAIWNQLPSETRREILKIVEEKAVSAGSKLICNILQSFTGFPQQLCTVIAKILYDLIKSKEL